MPTGRIASTFGKALGALVKPAIPEIAERVVPERMSAIPMTRSPGLPFTGDPALARATRATEHAKPTLEEHIHNLKSVMGSFFRADPNLPKDLQATLYKGRWRREAAGNVANLELEKVYEPLQTNPPQQAALMYDYLVTGDEVAQALRAKKTTVHGAPVEKWIDQLAKLEPQVANDPEISVAIERRRELWDKLFDDMLNRGWTIPEHYLEDYTPIRKLHAVAQGLAAMNGEAARSKLLASMQHRTSAEGFRETNLVALEKEVLSQYMRKVAEHEMFLELLDDPTINATAKFKPGDLLPRDYAVYRPGPGMVGHARKSEEGYFLDGLISGLELPDNVVAPDGYVFPRALVKSLNQFNGPKPDAFSQAAVKAGGKVSRWLTAYNPANTRLNQFADLPFAMFGGLPGEKAQPVGVFKWWLNVGAPAAYKGAYGKGGTRIKLHGQEIDVWDQAQREGLTEGTIHHEVMGDRLSDSLRKLHTPQELPMVNPVLDALQRDRLAVEAAPRIAAGLEAWERTGDFKEFGRVGRAITLTYGAGAPFASRVPIVRLVSPFLQFVGLASARVFDLLRAPESRNRALVGVLAVPTLTYFWNNQNEEFKGVEAALSEWEQSQAHIILSDPNDPTKVRRDITGKPVVLRFRYWVPEDVLRTAGLGNLTARVARVKEGRDTPIQFMKSIPQQASENLSDLLVMPGLVKDVAEGKTRTGQEMKWPDRLMRLFPIARPFAEAAEARDYGPGEMAKRFAQEAGGVRFASVSRRGKVLRDTDLMVAKNKVMQMRAKWRNAMMNDSPAKAREYEKDFNDAKAEFKRIATLLREQKKERNDAK